MRIFNLKTAARTLIFLKEHGIDSYDELREKSDTASTEFHQLSSRLKEIGDRQKAIIELQYHIGHYSKEQKIYEQYKASGFDQALYEPNRAPLTLRKAGKNYFDSIGMKKLPSINALKQEWAPLETEGRKLSPGYKTTKEKYLSLCTAKANADVMLSGSRQTQKSHDRGAR